MKSIQFWFAVLLAVGTGLARAEPPVPLLWKVSDANNSLYLLGSFHMLKASDYPLAQSTDAAFVAAKQVYFELSPQDANDPALGQRMAQAATRTDGTTLQQSLSPQTWKKLENYAARNNMQAANFQGMKPWFVGLVLTMGELQKQGLDPALGLDNHFMDRAAKAGKPTKGLETGDSQIALFDGMSAKQQDQFLQEVLDDAPQAEAKLAELHAIWRRADDKALFQKMALEMRRLYPDLYQSINVARNKAWLPKLVALLKDNDKDDILVIVGALHLVGEDGIVKMLADKGYRVERIK